MSGTATASTGRPGSGGHDPHNVGHSSHGGHGSATGGDHGGPAPKNVIVGYGFWIFLLSDIVMFSAFFAAYAVLAGQTAGGPTGRELFEPWRVAVETGCLLLSSFTCGLSYVGAQAKSQFQTQFWLFITGLLGLIFVILEVQEFATMIGEGAGPGRSAFLSSFFALVGLHGLHVSVGGLWLATMMAQIWLKGFRPNILRRLLCFNLFWHALDIVWVALFTIVYLLGMGI